MSGGKMPNSPAAAPKAFSSTPVKITQGNECPTSRDLIDGVLTDDEDTFSLLSPIYHDSFDSGDEDLDPSPVQQTLPGRSDSPGLRISPVRCELPKTPSDQMLSADVHPASTTLNAWEKWLLNKAKEERLRLERKTKEERLFQQKKEQQEREEMQRKIVIDEKIQDWLKKKREKEKHDQIIQRSREEEALHRQQQKQREIEQKAQQKYKDWLQRKNREKIEKENKEKEQAALKQEQERERQKRAEQKFKEWLEKANEKSRASPKSPSYTTSPYDKSYPSPSFCNPIPWKPIHVPPPEASMNEASAKKPQKQRTSQQSPGNTFRVRNAAGAGQLLQRR